MPVTANERTNDRHANEHAATPSEDHWTEDHWTESLTSAEVDRVLDAVNAGKPFGRILREKPCTETTSHDPNPR